MNIEKIGATVLRKQAEELPEITDEIKALISDMTDTMHGREGVGLAAPQVGRAIRLVIYQTPEEMDAPEAMINPVIISHSIQEEQMEEGCLSVPEERHNVSRYKRVQVEYTGVDGQKKKKRFRDLPARIVQHEIDHLNGILFIDRVSEETKAEMRNRLGKANIK